MKYTTALSCMMLPLGYTEECVHSTGGAASYRREPGMFYGPMYSFDRGGNGRTCHLTSKSTKNIFEAKRRNSFP